MLSLLLVIFISPSELFVGIQVHVVRKNIYYRRNHLASVTIINKKTIKDNSIYLGVLSVCPKLVISTEPLPSSNPHLH